MAFLLINQKNAIDKRKALVYSVFNSSIALTKYSSSFYCMFSITEKATQKRTKLHNKRLVLKTIYDRGPISRADVARTTHLARTTVSTVVALLMAEGLVEEVGQRLLERGKPATLLRVNKDACHIIGVDLAGREFSGAVNDLRGDVIQRHHVSFAHFRGEVALERVYQLIDELVAAASRPLLGIGVGVPGVVDVEQGSVRQSDRLEWRDVPLRKLLADRYNLPIYIANDSHVAAFGEYSFGNGRDVSNLVVIMVGLGISAGVVLNGRLHFGDSFGAGEIGHITVVKGEEARLCSCGRRGCLETVVNESILIEQAKEIARRNPHSKLHQFAKAPAAITGIHPVLQAFEAGDEDLQRVIKQMGKRLGYSAAAITSILNVERIVISGSMARFGAPLLAAIEDECKKSIHPMLASHTQIRASNLGSDIVIKGAVAMVLSSEMELV